MSTTSNILTGAPVTGSSFTATGTPGFIGDGSQLTNLNVVDLALNHADYAVITDSSSHLTTEQFLATSRGGFGINPTTLSGAVVVNAGVIANVAYTNANTASTIVQRDASGNFTASNVTLTQLIETPNANGQTTIQSAYVSTAAATATTLLSIGTVSGGTHGTTYLITADISLGDVTGGVNTGSYQFTIKAKNIGGTLTISSLINEISILDGDLTTTSVSVTNATTNLLIQVVGTAATTIQWCGVFKIVQVNF
jgi:hypothetical protein